MKSMKTTQYKIINHFIGKIEGNINKLTNIRYNTSYYLTSDEYVLVWKEVVRKKNDNKTIRQGFWQLAGLFGTNGKLGFSDYQFLGFQTHQAWCTLKVQKQCFVKA
jgi:hypothetical protein